MCQTDCRNRGWCRKLSLWNRESTSCFSLFGCYTRVDNWWWRWVQWMVDGMCAVAWLNVCFLVFLLPAIVHIGTALSDTVHWRRVQKYCWLNVWSIVYMIQQVTNSLSLRACEVNELRVTCLMKDRTIEKKMHKETKDLKICDSSNSSRHVTQDYCFHDPIISTTSQLPPWKAHPQDSKTHETLD